jgi:O-antigen ligase
MELKPDAAKPPEQTRRRERSPALYWHLDTISEYLIYAILIFTPWAFATTENWAIKSVNAWNFVLGGLLVAKWIVRVVTGFQPPRWDGPTALRGANPRWIILPLAALTVIMLAFCAVSAWNARADFLYEEGRFQYFEDYRKWLPHSYDRSATWEAFRLYLAVACFFWSLRDWVRTKTRREAKAEQELYGPAAIGPDAAEISGGYSYDPSRFPSRLKRLLWVLCFNGAALAIQGTLQRLSSSNELLWMVRPQLNAFYWQQFGPFNYRSNGAQYLNMIWPVALAFWWALNQQRKKKFGEGSEFLLLPFAGLMLGAPIIANSRGGVAIAVAQMLGVIGIFAYSYRKSGWRKTATVALAILVVAGFFAALTWQRLSERIQESSINTLGGRLSIHENTRKIIQDYPVWGAGPGAFAAVYQLYREPDQPWYAFTHDDYLQTAATFGRVGFFLLLTMLSLAFLYWFIARGIPTSELFVAFLWMAAGGCLLHARFDFPLQNYAILLLFMTLLAILTTMARRK